MDLSKYRDRFALARIAYRRGDVKIAEMAHSDDHLKRSLREHRASSQHLADAVLGATDGIVTTFAVVAGAEGARLRPEIVIIMGLANLVADGFSMAVSNYLGARSQQDYWREERNREMWEMQNIPAAEQEEIRRLYQRKGFQGETLEEIVKTITGDSRRWADEMMREELGIFEEKIAPVRSGLVTFVAFTLAGFLPISSYLMAYLLPDLSPRAFSLSIGITAISFFLVGVARRWMTHRPWWESGLEILGLGGFAAFCAYAVGYFLRALTG